MIPHMFELRNYLANQAQLPFRLGVHDCTNFVAGALQAGWGNERNFFADLGYWDRRSAVKRLRLGGGLKAAITRVLGPMRPIQELNVGDVVWFDNPNTVGLLLPAVGLYVAVKGHYEIRRLEPEKFLNGWRTA